MSKSKRQTEGRPQAARDGSSRVRAIPTWVIAVVLVLLAGGATYALFEFVILAKLPPELVGKWRVVDGPWEGLTMEFRRDGAMIGRKTNEGQERLLEGRAELSGKILRTTTVNPFTRKAETGKQKIVTLTETELVTEEGGVRITMRRVP